jgi:tetratricopeptide (TPR) repeat protein
MAFVVMAFAGTAPAFAASGDTARVHDARVHYEQAVANYNLDELAPALAEFREAYRLKPDPSFLFNIAQCYRKLGQVDAALDFYRKYLRSLPNAPNRADVERIVADLRAHQASATTPEAAPATHPSVTAAPVIEAPVAPAPVAPLVVPAPAPPAPPATRVDVLVATPETAPTPAVPLYRRWWFWTALGAVVAGAAIGGYAASRPGPRPYQGTLDPPTVGVP